MITAHKAAFEWPKAAVVGSMTSPPIWTGSRCVRYEWARVRQVGAQWTGVLPRVRAGSAVETLLGNTRVRARVRSRWCERYFWTWGHLKQC
jgi:hypothetical protein